MSNYVPSYSYPIVDNDGWKNLSGELPVKMTNDYLFRALLQSDNETLKAILSSVLKISVKRIRSAKITNPILLGKQIDSKTFILDVSVELNNRSIITLEMQVIKEQYWRDRSLSYICRAFDSLNRSIGYGSVKPVKQIAFCDFTLFKKAPEFYATYKIINVRKLEVVYSESFVISNIDLTRIDLATPKDKKYGLDRWAKLFKAETWEDMKMLAEKDKAMEKTISGIWQLTEEEMIREQCYERERWLITYEEEDKKHKKIAEQNKKLREKIKNKDAEIKRIKADKDAEIKDKDAEIKDKDAEIARLKEELSKRTSKS